MLPRNYAQLPDEQKVIVLINLERTARRLSPFDSGNPQLSGNDPVLGYALLERFATEVAERLAATRIRLLDLYGHVAGS